MVDADDKVPKPPVTVTKPTYLPYFARPKADTPVQPPRREVRGLWISRFDLGSAPIRRERLVELVNRAADAGFNVILLQVRATGDAYYSPGLEPWSYRLTSAWIEDLGRDPGWDPLAVAIETAHARGLQLHAYLNAFSMWECGLWGAAAHDPGAPVLAARKLRRREAVLRPHLARGYARVNGEPLPMGDAKTDPVACFEYILGSPGVDRVHQQNLAVFKDLAARYAIDGIHLDRVRYPGRQDPTIPKQSQLGKVRSRRSRLRTGSGIT